jgi:hypothetical protein
VSIATARRISSPSVGWVPLMKISLTVFLVNGPGFIPVNASTVASTRPGGRFQVAIGMPLLTSRMMRDQSGADELSDRVSVLGALLLLPIHTPTARAGAFLSFGGAR